MRLAYGDIWECGAEAVIVPVCSSGIPQGVLYEAIGRYPALLSAYKRLALGYEGFFAAGGVGVYLTPALLPSTILLVSVKQFPPDDADLTCIARALPALRAIVERRGIRSLAMPAMPGESAINSETLWRTLCSVARDVRIVRQL